MKTKLFAGLFAAFALAAMAAPASAQDFRRDGNRDGAYQGDRGYGDYDRGYGDRDRDFRGGRGDWRGRGGITIRNNGRSFTVNRDDRMFYRLLDRPYGFQPGLTYAYSDRCNRWGCVVFVFDNYHRWPIDRIFAPHLQMRGYAWRQARGFEDGYRSFGEYDRDDRGWNNSDDRNFRDNRRSRGDGRWDGRDGRRDGEHGGLRERGELEGGPYNR